MDLTYEDGFTLVRPYGNESGSGWGRGIGTVTGEALAGSARWSNHPQRRGDGAMLPSARGVITTRDGAEVLFDLSGRTVWETLDGHERGVQLLTAVFESEDDRYAWLNNCVCICEGSIDPETLTLHLDVHRCTPGS